MQRFRVCIAVFFALASCVVTWVPARAETDEETKIKAVMIRKFVEFIRWPDAVSPQKTMQVHVCVYGDSPLLRMAAMLEKASANAPIKYRLTSIAQLSEAAGSCHVVFFAPSKIDQLGGLKGQPVLTVSDAPGFADRGGMIGFQLIEGKVRYNINNKAFSAAQIKVDAQLLEIAHKVVE